MAEASKVEQTSGCRPDRSIYLFLSTHFIKGPFVFSRNQVNTSSFWADDLTESHGTHLPEVLRQLSAPSSWKCLSSWFGVLFYNKSWLNLKQSHKKWPWNFIRLRGGVQSKTNSREPLWTWPLNPEPWLFQVVVSRFWDLAKPACVPRERERETSLGLEGGKKQ